MRLLTALGTRPEVIKLAPVIHALRRRGAEVIVCATGQHREMFDPLLRLFDIKPDYELNAMRAQSLAAMTGEIVAGVGEAIEQSQPDAVLVHGDTATTMAASVAAFLQGTRIGHIEAGLRTGDLRAPWPEEACRRVSDLLAHWYFAPTTSAKRHLLSEGVAEERVFVTGNTVIDSLQWVLARLEADAALRARLEHKFAYLGDAQRVILVTGHRRENFGDGLADVCQALNAIAHAHPEVRIVYPVHLNPNVHAQVHSLLDGANNIHLIEPQDYIDFVYLMRRAYFIVTDSGGIQEEAPMLGKPVLVTRKRTERPEAVKVGAARLVGTNAALLIGAMEQLLNDQHAYAWMAKPRTVYGDGRASGRIAQVLLQQHLKPVAEHTARATYGWTSNPMAT